MNSRKIFVQARLADLREQTPLLLPEPESELLRDQNARDGEAVHHLDPSAVPETGVRVEARYVLARAIGGDPCLWLQRERTARSLGPARQLLYDLLIPDVQGADLGRAPAWFFALSEDERPALPLPDGLIFGERDKEYVYRDGSVLVWVPPGRFLMGATSDPPPNSQPTSLVQLSGFFIGKYPVRWEQYRLFASESGRLAPAKRDGWPTDIGYPVYNVSWFDARAYCVHYGLRLVTQAEWEYAARGSDGRKYPWGDGEPSEELCNWSGHPAGRPTQVDAFPAGASPFGCFDMAGNLFEHTFDYFVRHGVGANEDPVHARAVDSEDRVIRGGSFRSSPKDCRSESRQAHPASLDDGATFRVALSSQVPALLQVAPRPAPVGLRVIATVGAELVEVRDRNNVAVAAYLVSVDLELPEATAELLDMEQISFAFSVAGAEGSADSARFALRDDANYTVVESSEGGRWRPAQSMVLAKRLRVRRFGPMATIGPGSKATSTLHVLLEFRANSQASLGIDVELYFPSSATMKCRIPIGNR